MTDTLHLEHQGAHRTAFRGSPEACARVLLVGEDNPQSQDPRHALFPYPEGCAGNRLMEKIFGLRRLAYLAIWRTNLCNQRWSTKAARARARALLDGYAPWSVIVMLGRKVADAFGDVIEDGERHRFDPFHGGELRTPCGQDPWGQYVMKTIELVHLPHPSGRCRIWNQPGAAADARKLLSELEPGIPWGEAL